MARDVEVPRERLGVAYFWVGDMTQEEFDNWLEDIIYRLQKKYPSIEPTEPRTYGNYRETIIIAENGLVYITVSEYCGICAISVVPKYEENGWDIEETRMSNLSYSFGHLVGQTLYEMSELIRKGAFSNGEAIYHMKSDGYFSSKEGHMEWMG